MDFLAFSCLGCCKAVGVQVGVPSFVSLCGWEGKFKCSHDHRFQKDCFQPMRLSKPPAAKSVLHPHCRK